MKKRAKIWVKKEEEVKEKEEVEEINNQLEDSVVENLRKKQKTDLKNMSYNSADSNSKYKIISKRQEEDNQNTKKRPKFHLNFKEITVKGKKTSFSSNRRKTKTKDEEIQNEKASNKKIKEEERDPRDVEIFIEENPTSNSVRIENPSSSKRTYFLTSESNLLKKIIIEDSESRRLSLKNQGISTFRIIMPSERAKKKMEKEIESIKNNKEAKEELLKENNADFNCYDWEVLCDPLDNEGDSDEEWTYSYHSQRRKMEDFDNGFYEGD